MGKNIGGTINVLAYTDDVGLTVENREDLKALVEKLIMEVGIVRLIINEDKKVHENMLKI